MHKKRTILHRDACNNPPFIIPPLACAQANRISRHFAEDQILCMLSSSLVQALRAHVKSLAFIHLSFDISLATTTVFRPFVGIWRVTIYRSP